MKRGTQSGGVLKEGFSETDKDSVNSHVCIERCGKEFSSRCLECSVIQMTASTEEDVEQGEHSSTTSGNANLYSLSGNQ